MQDNQEPIPSKRNPLLWIGVIMAGLIVYVLISGDRGPSREDDTSLTEVPSENVTIVEESTFAEDSPAVEPDNSTEALPEGTGIIDRALLIPPGMRAREYIAQLREQGMPYPLDEASEKAATYQNDGSLADAYLLYFFAAREGHASSMLEMARINDPRFFKPDNALLDEPDAIQALKWYRLAQQSNVAEAASLLESLRAWAETESATGSEVAEQILLNFR